VIPEIEFKELSRAFKVPISSIERDYAQGWLLAYLPPMAFKGGTGIRKTYIKNYRFSDDLDFTLLDKINISDLRIKIQNAIKKTRTSSGIPFLDDLEAEDVENGYIFTAYFRILRKSGDPLKVKMDITKKENEKIFTPVEKRNILHVYSDKFDKQIKVYTLEEIFAEKVRSLFERTRPRDLYDVWFLNKNVNLNKTLFMNKCKFKKVKPNIDELLARKLNYERTWEASLQHQLSELPPFKKVFNDVIWYLKSSF